MSEAMKNSIDVLNRLSEIADGLSAEVSAIQSLADRAKAALSGAQQGEAEPVAWAVFADNGNIRIWGREKPAGFPEAVPLYLSPTVKDFLTVQSEPIGYADPDSLNDYRAGDRLHIPVYRPDASEEWQSGIPVYLHPAPPSVAVPEGWRLVPVEPTTEMLAEGAIALFAQSREPLSSAYRSMLAAAPRCPMLTAAPSGDAKREAEIKAEALESMANKIERECPIPSHDAGVGECLDMIRQKIARLRTTDDKAEGV